MSGNSPKLPFRSAKTWLSDDELLLYDLVFNCFAPLRSFRRADYPDCLNTAYTHALNDDAVDFTVNDHVTRGLMQRQDSLDTAPVFGLTPAGGRLWEMERQPVWERFCQSSGAEDGWTIASPSAEICTAYFEATTPRVSNPSASTPRLRPLAAPDTEGALIPWRPFGQIFELRLPKWDHTAVDWDRYESERIWWLNVAELQRFSGYA